MGVQKGILKFEGTIGGLTFYNSVYGYLVRQKAGVSGDRVKTDPAFSRTRENGLEFGAASKAGKFLRESLHSFTSGINDKTLPYRLTQVLSKIQKLDTIGVRGQRNVHNGLQTPEGFTLLRDFLFNKEVSVQGLLSAPLLLDAATGKVSCPDPLVPSQDISYPPGATHLNMQSAALRINFIHRESRLVCSEPLVFALTNDPVNVELTLPELPEGDGVLLHLLRIDFLQQVNGMEYGLSNGGYNAVGVVG
ncbi:MAG: hypothetical protein V4616_05185 [Bacteroidota bacterium]